MPLRKPPLRLVPLRNRLDRDAGLDLAHIDRAGLPSEESVFSTPTRRLPRTSLPERAEPPRCSFACPRVRSQAPHGVRPLFSGRGKEPAGAARVESGYRRRTKPECLTKQGAFENDPYLRRPRLRRAPCPGLRSGQPWRIRPVRQRSRVAVSLGVHFGPSGKEGRRKGAALASPLQEFLRGWSRRGRRTKPECFGKREASKNDSPTDSNWPQASAPGFPGDFRRERTFGSPPDALEFAFTRGSIDIVRVGQQFQGRKKGPGRKFRLDTSAINPIILDNELGTSIGLRTSEGPLWDEVPGRA